MSNLPTLHPGRILMTPGAMDALEQAKQLPSEFLAKHCLGEWGDLDAHDASANRRALTTGDCLLSSYKTANDDVIWIVTDAVDMEIPGTVAHVRATTTMLLPSEY